MAIGCKTVMCAAVKPAQNSTNNVHTRIIAGFLQRSVKIRTFSSGYMSCVKQENTAIHWPTGLLNEAEKNFGFGLSFMVSFNETLISGFFQPPVIHH